MTDYPDFTVIARLKGEYNGLEKAVALDVNGALQTLLYGTYDSANKKILIDVDGNVRMNLYAQDLDEMINRFKYGAPNTVYNFIQPLKDDWREIFEITGKGQIYTCHCHFETTVSQAALRYRLTMDGEVFGEVPLSYMNDWNYYKPEDWWEHLKMYDDINFRYVVNFTPGWTFETQYKLEVKHLEVTKPDVYYLISYTLI